jgi:hypothetical protein
MSFQNIDPDSIFAFYPSVGEDDPHLNTQIELLKWAKRQEQPIQFFDSTSGLVFHVGMVLETSLNPHGEYEAVIREELPGVKTGPRRIVKVNDMQMLSDRGVKISMAQLGDLLSKATVENKGVAFEVKGLLRHQLLSGYVQRYSSDLKQAWNVIQGRLISVRSGNAILELDGGDIINVRLDQIVPGSVAIFDIFPIPTAPKVEALRKQLAALVTTGQPIEFKKPTVLEPVTGRIEGLRLGSDLLPWVKIEVLPKHANFYLPLEKMVDEGWTVTSKGKSLVEERP